MKLQFLTYTNDIVYFFSYFAKNHVYRRWCVNFPGYGLNWFTSQDQALSTDMSWEIAFALHGYGVRLGSW